MELLCAFVTEQDGQFKCTRKSRCVEQEKEVKSCESILMISAEEADGTPKRHDRHCFHGRVVQ